MERMVLKYLKILLNTVENNFVWIIKIIMQDVQTGCLNVKIVYSTIIER